MVSRECNVACSFEQWPEQFSLTALPYTLVYKYCSGKLLGNQSGRMLGINLWWTCIHSRRVGMLINMHLVLEGQETFWHQGIGPLIVTPTYHINHHHLHLHHHHRYYYCYLNIIVSIYYSPTFSYFISVQESKTGWNNSLCYWSCIVWYKTGTLR